MRVIFSWKFCDLGYSFLYCFFRFVIGISNVLDSVRFDRLGFRIKTLIFVDRILSEE